MAGLLNSTHRRHDKACRSSLCAVVTLLLATATLYLLVALRFSNTAPLPFSSIAPQHHDTVHPSDSPIDSASLAAAASNPFALHPELHISRPPRTLRLNWSVTRQQHRPDGVLRHVYFINGQFPGPTIEARSGDELQITLTNNIVNDTDAGIAIHWHGLLMKDFNEMDGAAGVTQCAILTGQSFTYQFKIDAEQHGTYWYHAHSDVKRADGLYGGFIIHKPADEKSGQSDLSRHEYDAERLLLVGDWYHRSAEKVLSEYKDFRNYAYEPVADSLLVNGVGSYNCTKVRPGRPVDCIETDVPGLHFAADKAVRLRVINTGAAAGFSMQLANGTLQLLTVDGGGSVASNTPKTPTIGVVYPGERIDMLLLPDDTIEDKGRLLDTTLKIILDPELMPMKNYALTRIQTFPLTWTRLTRAKSPYTRQRVREQVNLLDIRTAHGPPIPENAAIHAAPQETALLYTSLGINSFKNDEPWGEVNRTSWVWKDPNAKPLLALDREAWAKGTEQANKLRTFTAPWYAAGRERWIDLVVNNIDDKGHPFHLHGYAFYIVSARQRDLGRTYNPFDPDVAAEEAHHVNTNTPLRKDTVYIQARGYVILRFPLDNAGLWLMHCHVLWHQAVGMGVVLQVGNITKATQRKAGESCIL